MQVTIRGAGADRIVIAGDIQREFTSSGAGDLLAFPDGHVLRVYFRDSLAKWKIDVVHAGAGHLSVSPAPEHDSDSRSDVAILTHGDEQLAWVVFGTLVAFAA